MINSLQIGTWYECFWPTEGMTTAQDMLKEVANRNGIADLSHGTLLWGQAFREFRPEIALRSKIDLTGCKSSMQASDWVAAEIVQFLSALQGLTRPIFCIQISGDVAPEALQGAIDSCQLAKADGLISSIGLHISCSQEFVPDLQEKWFMFDYLLTPSNSTAIRQIAISQNVKVIDTSNSQEFCTFRAGDLGQ